MRARVLLDGGAYASSSTAVCSNAASFACGPYDVPNALIDAYVVYTDNPPCGAMRGFGAVQTCFAHEAQMDKLAAELEIDPVELRLRNAMSTGSTLPTGAPVRCPAPVEELLERVRDDAGARRRRAACPAASPTSPAARACVRGVGYAVGYKNIGYSEGFDDYSTARVRLSLRGRRAAGRGPHRRRRGRPGPRHRAGADRPHRAGRRPRRRAARRHPGRHGRLLLGLAPDDDDRRRGEGRLRGGRWRSCAPAATAALADGPIEATREYHHRETFPLDENGQGDAHVTFAFAAHRAVVDVDTELGLVRVVEIATAQDVGKAINPQAVEGQIEGGIAQGLGLALMEEIQVVDGEVRNASFTDYLIPTVLDMPPVRLDVLELGDPEAPYGLRGVGEPPTISSTPGDRGRAARRHRRGADARARPPRRHGRAATMPVPPAELTAHFTIDGPRRGAGGRRRMPAGAAGARGRAGRAAARRRRAARCWRRSATPSSRRSTPARTGST